MNLPLRRSLSISMSHSSVLPDLNILRHFLRLFGRIVSSGQISESHHQADPALFLAAAAAPPQEERSLFSHHICAANAK